MTLQRTISLVDKHDDRHTVILQQHSRHLAQYELRNGSCVSSQHLVSPRTELEMRTANVVLQLLAYGYAIDDDVRYNVTQHV